MKLALVAAVLLPIGYVLWPDAPDNTPTANTSAQTPIDSLAPAVAAAELDASRASPAPDPGPDAVAAARPHESAEPPTARPLMRLDLVGPKAFRAAFAHTNLGLLMASEEGERLWRPLATPAEHIWRQWDGGGDAFGTTRQRVLEYAGRIRVLWMAQPGEGRERDRVFGVLAVDTDGSTDLAALGGDISRAMQGFMPGEPTAQGVGEHTLRVLGETGREFVTVPVVIGGSLVAFFGEAGSLDQAVPVCLRALANEPEPPSAPVSLRVDLTQLKDLQEMRTEPPLVKAFGLESLRSFRATLRPNGVHVELGLEIELGDGRRGIMDAFLPAVDTLPTLLARVPPRATPWLTVPFRPDVLYRVGLAAAAEYRERDGESRTDLREQIHQELGLHIDTDLLDHLGGEVMVIGDLWQAEDPETFRAGDDPPLGACIAWSLKDAAAFRRGFEKLLRYLKGQVHLYETREVDGVEITRLGSAFLTGMHMAVGQDLFALAFGKEGVVQLEELVTRGRGGAARPLPAAIQGVQHLAPAGWNGAGLADLTALFGGQVTLVLEALEDSLPRQMGFEFSVDETQKWLDRLLPLIATHELENLVTMTGYHDGRWRLRLLW